MRVVGLLKPPDPPPNLSRTQPPGRDPPETLNLNPKHRSRSLFGYPHGRYAAKLGLSELAPGATQAFEAYDLYCR